MILVPLIKLALVDYCLDSAYMARPHNRVSPKTYDPLKRIWFSEGESITIIKNGFDSKRQQNTIEATRTIKFKANTDILSRRLSGSYQYGSKIDSENEAI